jgi:hypothetical protein
MERRDRRLKKDAPEIPLRQLEQPKQDEARQSFTIETGDNSCYLVRVPLKPGETGVVGFNKGEGTGMLAQVSIVRDKFALLQATQVIPGFAQLIILKGKEISRQFALELPRSCLGNKLASR